ncbi:GNAT family N-acetyltransferase [Hamadaea sp. NPDC050747]|uniref:GNAT family N-acetyltransferase n=1 Tax=Hamadaea sp. NPDC050747 TaxID=3155789 RepID=UPI0033D144EB
MDTPVTGERLRIVAAGPRRDEYLPLLRLADDSPDQIRGYYQHGDLYVLEAADGVPLGVVLVLPRGGEVVELKAVAVDTVRQGQGIGRRMLASVLSDLRSRGMKSAVVGTASSGVGELAFYQKAGFRLRDVERDYFSRARGYPDDLQDNGISVRDMVWMDQRLD